MQQLIKRFRTFFKDYSGMDLPPLDFYEHLTNASSYKLAYEQVDWDVVQEESWDNPSEDTRDAAYLKYDAEIFVRLAEIVDKARELDKLDDVQGLMQRLDEWGGEDVVTYWTKDSSDYSMGFSFMRSKKPVMVGAMIYHPRSKEWSSHT